MTDAAIPTDQPAEIPPAAAAEPAAPASDGDAETEDARTARQRILDHFDDTAEAGDQTTVQICAGTGLARSLVDPLLSRLTKQGVLERTAPATYRLAPPKPAPPPPPAPAEVPRIDGIALAEWVTWLHDWDRGGRWQGRGKPPDRETGIVVAGGGCLVPLLAWSTFLGERDALIKQRAEDDALRDQLVLAANGNIVRGSGLNDVRPLRVMLASGIDIATIEQVIRAKHDRRNYPKNPPFQSWAELMKPVAEHYGRFVLGRKLLERWRERLADPSATTDASPTLKRALSEIAPEKPTGVSESVASDREPPALEVAPAPSPARPAAVPGAEGSSAAAMLLERYGGGVDEAVAAVSGDDGGAPSVMPPPRPVADGRDQILAAFNRGRGQRSQPAAPPIPPSRPPADRDEIAGRIRDRRQEQGAHPVTSEGGRAWFANPEPEPPSPSMLAYDEIVEAFAVGNLVWARSLWGPPPNEPGTRVPVGVRRKYGFA